MPFSQPFDDTFRQEVAVLTQDSTLPDTALHNDAAQHLQVLAHPSFADINQPAWVRRIQQFTWMWIMYTSSGLFRALYQTADQLGLAVGKRYVSATVCVSARQAESVAAISFRERERCIAEALSQLATAWTAHFLWPCVAVRVRPIAEALSSVLRMASARAERTLSAGGGVPSGKSEIGRVWGASRRVGVHRACFIWGRADFVRGAAPGE